MLCPRLRFAVPCVAGDMSGPLCDLLPPGPMLSWWRTSTTRGDWRLCVNRMDASSHVRRMRKVAKDLLRSVLVWLDAGQVNPPIRVASRAEIARP